MQQKNLVTNDVLPRAADLVGGCQCGALRYRISGDPITVYVCHCHDCQKQSASAFGMSLWADSTKFQLLRGELSFYHTQGDSGAVKNCAYCQHCGTRIYHTSDQPGAILSVKAGSLDDTSHLRPVAHLWTRRAQPWIGIDCEKMVCFETEPPDDQILVDLWRNANP